MTRVDFEVSAECFTTVPHKPFLFLVGLLVIVLSTMTLIRHYG